MTPLYLKWLGIEAYGLVGLFATLQSILTWLDAGISPTMARTLSQLSGRDDPSARQEMRDVVMTFGLVIVGIGAAAGLALAAFAPLGRRWLGGSTLSAGTVTAAIMLMGLNVALQWPNGFFLGGLMALERQVAGNLAAIVTSTLRAALTAAMLVLVSRRIELFFLGQALGAGLGTLATALLLSRALPPLRGHFRRSLFERHWRFAAGMTGTAITTVIATQVDNVALSRFVPLAEFGTYSLGRTISNSISNLSGSLAAAFYPRYCKQADGADPGLAGFYHLTCQVMAVIAFSTCLTVAAFADTLVYLWTGNAVTAAQVAPPLRLLALAAGVQSAVVLPYYLQLAHGWTQLAIKTNLLNLAITAPITLTLVWRYGALGAAASVLVFNLVYASLIIPAMHKRILPGELLHWFKADVLLPGAGALALVVAARWVWPAPQQRPAIALGLALVGGLALFASALSSSGIRAYAGRRWAR